MLVVIHHNLFSLRNVSERPLKTQVGRGGMVDEAPCVSWIYLGQNWCFRQGDQIPGWKPKSSTNSVSVSPIFFGQKVAWTLKKSDILTLLTATAIEFPNLIFYSLTEPWKSQTFLHFLQQQLLNFQTLFSIASLNLEKVRHSYTSYSNSYWISKPFFL